MNKMNDTISRQSSRLANEIKDPLSEKITELFHMCDEGNKGYVTRDDLFRLKDELGLDEKEVESAFEELDTDHDNYLTLEEFLAGFGLFLGVERTVMPNSEELKPDFTFQVFNLIDKEDKGHITKEDLREAAATLEIDVSQIDYIYRRLRTMSEVIYFEDFINNIGTIIALSPALQEIKEFEDAQNESNGKKEIVARVFKIDVTGYDDGEIEDLLLKQANFYFNLCDFQKRKYVTKEDVSILTNELPLSLNQVSLAFDFLDSNNKGYLTMHEFLRGFRVFLGIQLTNSEKDLTISSSKIDKVQQLFNICDVDNKGYVTQNDLHKLTSELGLENDQIEDIFSKLDSDGDGFITLEEFVDGFSSFMFNETAPDDEDNEKSAVLDFDEKYFMDSRPIRKDPSSLEKKTSSSSEHKFIKRQMSMHYETSTSGIEEMLHNIEKEVGSSMSKEQLEELWYSVSNAGDQMTTQLFENFLSRVHREIKDARQEAKLLEDALERKVVKHDAEIKKICDEMEMQLQTEKAKQRELEVRRESILREDLYGDLKEKEKQIEKFMQRETALENRLFEVREQEQALKHQNTKLLKENVMLEDQLNNSISNMESLKENLRNLELQTREEKKETLKAAFQATQGIQYEHENLVKQLHLLKSVNQKLRDDRDTIEASLKSKVVRLPSVSELSHQQRVHRVGSVMDGYLRDSPLQRNTPSLQSVSSPTHKPLTKKGSVLSNYFEPMGNHIHSPPFGDPFDDEFGFNKEHPLNTINEKPVPHTSSSSFTTDDVMDDVDSCNNPKQSSMIEEAEIQQPDKLLVGESLIKSTYENIETSSTPSSPRHPPYGRNDEDSHSIISSASNVPAENPSRVYKIVLVGDSGVGKSSFIHRFCFDDFRPNFTATIGVDFQVKTLTVNREMIALQLWDTAGQERFRSITKQYFRRADGVVVMFDLTSWSSYTNVKGWMLNVEEGAEPDCVVMLLGNKKDLVTRDSSFRKVQYESAVKLAKDYNADYMEVSACSGEAVVEAMQKMAKKMEMSEDSLMRNSVLNLNVQGEPTKKKCCR